MTTLLYTLCCSYFIRFFSTLVALLCLNAMNWRDFTLISVATLFGAAASATAIRLFFNPRTRRYNNNNKCCSAFDSESNGVVQSGKSTSSSHNPFDPSNRKGLVTYLKSSHLHSSCLFVSPEIKNYY